MRSHSETKKTPRAAASLPWSGSRSPRSGTCPLCQATAAHLRFALRGPSGGPRSVGAGTATSWTPMSRTGSMTMCSTTTGAQPSGRCEASHRRPCRLDGAPSLEQGKSRRGQPFATQWPAAAARAPIASAPIRSSFQGRLRDSRERCPPRRHKEAGFHSSSQLGASRARRISEQLRQPVRWGRASFTLLPDTRCDAPALQ